MKLYNNHLTVERSIVNLFILSTTVYFFAINWFLFSESKDIVIIFLLPIILVLSWVLIILANYGIIIRALSKFKKIIRVLSPMHKIFYGMLSILALYLLIIPILSPMIVFGLSVFIPYIITRRLVDKIPKSLLIILFCAMTLSLMMGLGILIVPFYFTFVKRTVTTFFSFFVNSVPVIFKISVCIGASASLGDFILLIYEGAHEYDPKIQIPLNKIHVTQYLLLIAFLLIVFMIHLSVATYLGFLMSLSFISNLIRRRKLMNGKEADINFYTAVVFLIFGFTGIISFSGTYFPIKTIIENLVLLSLIIAMAVYIGLFLWALIVSIDEARI